MLSEKRREEIDNEFAKVFGADFPKNVLKGDTMIKKEDEDVCKFIGFEEWLNGLRSRGIISQKRIEVILRGLAPEEAQFSKTYHDVIQIDKHLCALKNQKKEIEDRLRKLKEKKR